VFFKQRNQFSVRVDQCADHSDSATAHGPPFRTCASSSARLRATSRSRQGASGIRRSQLLRPRRVSWPFTVCKRPAVGEPVVTSDRIERRVVPFPSRPGSLSAR
jgi:hypothetical protein